MHSRGEFPPARAETPTHSGPKRPVPASEPATLETQEPDLGDFCFALARSRVAGWPDFAHFDRPATSLEATYREQGNIVVDTRNGCPRIRGNVRRRRVNGVGRRKYPSRSELGLHCQAACGVRGSWASADRPLVLGATFGLAGSVH
jgi:hypothetical protein